MLGILRRRAIKFLSTVVVSLLASALSVGLWDEATERAGRRTAAALVSKDADEQTNALKRLDHSEPETLIRSFRNIADDPDGHLVLTQTIRALGKKDGDRVVGLLIDALDDNHERVRLYAAMTLAFLGTDSLPVVITTLRTAPEVRVRTSAAWILSLMGNQPSAIAALEEARGDESKDVRYSAEFSLHQLRSSSNTIRTKADRLRARPLIPHD